MKSLKKTLFVVLIANAVVLAINLVSNYRYYTSGNDWRFSVFFSLCVTTFGVLSGTLILHPLFQRFKWTERPTLKLIISVLIFAVYGLTLMFLSMKAMNTVFHMNYGTSSDDFIPNMVYSVLFSIIIGLIISGRAFLISLKKSIEDNERIKQEMIQSQYETLKNQVNPHFLFNSLNTLTVMIPNQPAVAVSFVEQMAKVFRYSLQHNDEHTVAVDTELKVVRSYLFLNEQRFDGKLNVDINIDAATLQKKIITHSLLMLVENAVKHNEISNEHPLRVKIYSEGNLLVAENTLQRKAIPEHSTHVGLENIKKRYALATATPVVITESNNLFVVKIPLLS